MRAPPEDFVETSALLGILAEGWGVEVAAIEYLPVGGGSYHWVITDLNGSRGFVNVDDLDQKPWLGETREAAFDGVRRAFDTAVALRHGGLEFVVAPIPTRRGESVRRIGPRHTVALLPFVDGQVGVFGHYPNADERAAVVRMLAELHAATPAVRSVARRIELAEPGCQHLEAALRELHQTWFGGPFSEPARQALASGASDVAELLAVVNGLSMEVARRCTNWVVTHGEPHAGNVMRTAGRHVLIDWDTAALAPPERDLWMVVSDTADEATSYAELTGHHLDQTAIDLFRLAWDLKDLDIFLDLLRSPHRRTADTLKAFEGVRTCVDNAATKL